MRQLADVIIKPVISEKSLNEARGGSYTFLVAKDADKGEIKRAIELLFKVEVKKVLTSKMHRKKTFLTRRGRKEKDFMYKKARAKLASGGKIEIFEEAVKENK